MFTWRDLKEQLDKIPDHYLDSKVWIQTDRSKTDEFEVIILSKGEITRTYDQPVLLTHDAEVTEDLLHMIPGLDLDH